MAEITYEQAAAGLAKCADLGPGRLAAVRLLLWHETWLRRPDFRRRCLTTRPVSVSWPRVREYRDAGPRGASSSQMTVLDVVLALADDTLGLNGLGHAHRRAVAEAFATALGQELTVAKPVHNHPDFIPCEPVCPVHQLEQAGA